MTQLAEDFQGRLVQLIEEYVRSNSDEAEIPVIDDYVLVASVSDVTDFGMGRIILVFPNGHWRYRLLGLLDEAYAQVSDARDIREALDDE